MSQLFTGVNHNYTHFNETQMGEIFGQGLFNVKAYGAMGSGAGDDGTSIQYALDAAQAVGGIAYFPPGVYKYGTTLNVTGRVHILGGGQVARWTGDSIGTAELSVKSSVILKYTGSSDGMHIYSDTNDAVLNGITIENIELVPSTDGGGRYGIFVDASDSSKCLSIAGLTLRNVVVQDWGTDGIYTKGTVFDVTFDRLSALDNVRYGVNIDDTSAQAGVPSQITFIDPWLFSGSSASSWAVYMDVAEVVRFFGGTIAGYGSSLGNGAFVRNGCSFFGTNIEGVSGANTIGVRYTGTNGLFLGQAQVSAWAIGVQIGNPNDKTANADGWVIASEISGNTTDLHVVDGGSRLGTVLHRGYGQTFVLDDDLLTTDGVHDQWAYIGQSSRVAEFSDGDKIIHENATTGFSVNANWEITDGTWNGGHLVLGTYHIWQASGVLYIKSGAPANATDGTIVGTQS